MKIIGQYGLDFPMIQSKDRPDFEKKLKATIMNALKLPYDVDVELELE